MTEYKEKGEYGEYVSIDRDSKALCVGDIVMYEETEWVVTRTHGLSLDDDREIRWMTVGTVNVDKMGRVTEEAFDGLD